MGIPRVDRSEEWFGSYPVEERLCVAGNSPPLADLDIPVIIDNVKDLTSGIEVAKRDFFNSQPVKRRQSLLTTSARFSTTGRTKKFARSFKHRDRNKQGL